MLPCSENRPFPRPLRATAARVGVPGPELLASWAGERGVPVVLLGREVAPALLERGREVEAGTEDAMRPRGVPSWEVVFAMPAGLGEPPALLGR